MTHSHIRASEIEVGGFYMAANANPYVREVTQIHDRFVIYNDYLYETGEAEFVNQSCTIRTFASWAAHKLTKEDAARMNAKKGHARAYEQAAAAFIASPQGLKMVSSWLALAVRNEVEDFHAASAEQTIKNTEKYMPEFNRSLRNAIYSGLYAIIHLGDGGWAKHYVDSISRVPGYWEEPELLPEIEELSELGDWHESG